MPLICEQSQGENSGNSFGFRAASYPWLLLMGMATIVRRKTVGNSLNMLSSNCFPSEPRRHEHDKQEQM